VKNRQQLLIIGAIIIAVLYISDTMLRPPLQKMWNDRKDQIKNLRAEIKRGKNLINGEQSLRRRWDIMRTNTLPVDTSVAEAQLYGSIQAWKENSTVTVGGINPQWKHDNDETYYTLDCRIEASGNMSTITRFLYEIESDPMGIRVELLELNSRDERGSQMTVNLQLSGLVLGAKGDKVNNNLQTAATPAEE
jgi:hypothetical protein